MTLVNPNSEARTLAGAIKYEWQQQQLYAHI